jgi:Gas vesicle protein
MPPPVLEGVDASLLDIVDHVLTKGIVLTGDLVLGVADIDLVYLRLSAVLCAADRILGPRPGAAKRRVRHGGGDPVGGRPALMANKIGAPRLGARPARSGRT